MHYYNYVHDYNYYNKLQQDPHGATSQKTAFLMVTAVNTSNPTFHQIRSNRSMLHVAV
jgi:hypothetical protein